MRPRIETYDLKRFDFISILCRLYDVENLGHLGRSLSVPILTRETDQSTVFHRIFYEAFKIQISSLYREFVAHFVPSMLGTPEFCFQRISTLRVHLPWNVAVGEFHTDGQYNHTSGELNFWMPFTAAWGTNTVWIEEVPGERDYRPVELLPGEVLMFDAVNWSHGNVANDTGSTRISFDFRCIPLSDYTPSELRTVNARRALRIGDYFDVFQ
jgi:hypothetical protein